MTIGCNIVIVIIIDKIKILNLQIHPGSRNNQEQTEQYGLIV